jgi:hypothetical protein
MAKESAGETAKDSAAEITKDSAGEMAKDSAAKVDSRDFDVVIGGAAVREQSEICDTCQGTGAIVLVMPTPYQEPIACPNCEAGRRRLEANPARQRPARNRAGSWLVIRGSEIH